MKKITQPILDQLKQGVSPDKLAQSIAFGIVIGTLPMLGVTTTLCVLAAFCFKLNHVAIQTVNYLVYPVQIILVIPFVKIGEYIFNRTPTPLNLLMVIDQFKNNFKLAFEKYFLLALLGVSTWALIAPFAFAIIYWISKNILIRVMQKAKVG